MTKIGFPNIQHFVKIYKYEKAKCKALDATEEETEKHIQTVLEAEARTICKVMKIVEPIIEEEFPNLNANKVDNKWFLTIRPRDELNIKHFVKFVDDLFQKRIFKNAKWVYEQNGISENEMGKGKHIHAICEMNSSNKGKKYFLNEIQNFVKGKGLGDYIYDNCIDFKKITTDKDLHNKEQYIRTDRFCKSTEDKEDSWKWNDRWRTSHNIRNEYTTAIARASGTEPMAS